MIPPRERHIEWIPIGRIAVLNPRLRDKRAFREIIENIGRIGLKRPITVSRRQLADGPAYDLVCGQGRLEAYAALGQQDVPALIVEADSEECFVASLVENCARRKHSALDLLQDIGRMQRAGHTVKQISQKIGMSTDYVQGIQRLMQNGEDRLMRAVDAGLMPLSVAIDIAESTDRNVQQALQDAYDKKLLRGRKLLAAQRLVEARRRRGKSLTREMPLSSADLVREFEADADRKRDVIHRGNATRDRLLLIAVALRRVLDDQNFLALLEAEGLRTIPASLTRHLTEEIVVD